MSVPLTPPIALRIKLPFPTEEDFLERYGQNLGRGAMFVPTRATKPEGTSLAFELVLAGGARLLAGEGVVVKAQSGEDGSRAGMTVRFLRLEPGGQALIDRAVERRAQAAAAAEKARSGPGLGASAASAGTGPLPNSAANTSAQRPAGVPSSIPARPTAARGAASPQPPGAAARSSASASPSRSEALPVGSSAGGERGAPPSARGWPQPYFSDDHESGERTEESSEVDPTAPPPEVVAQPAPERRTETGGRTQGERQAASELSPSRAVPDPRAPIADVHSAAALPLPPAETRTATPGEMRQASSRETRPATFGEERTEAAAGPSSSAPTDEADEERTPESTSGAAQETASSEPIPAANTADEPLGVGHAPHPDPLPAGEGDMRTRSRDRLRAILNVEQTAAPIEPDLTLVGIDLGSSATRISRLTDGDRGAELAAPGLSSALRALQQSAARSRCVIALPAGAGTTYRHVIHEQFTRAGVEARRLLHGTSAAGLSFASTRQLARQRVLVVDWGETKLELALQVITGDDIEVLALQTVGEIGTAAFDAALVAALAPDREVASRLNSVRAARLLLERSDRSTAQVDGMEATLGRGLLERVAAPFLARASAAIAAVLEAGKLAPASLDARVVAGWPAYASWVREGLSASAGGPLEPLRADAVAHGAALFARALEERDAGRPAARISELLGAPIGLLHADGSLTRVIEPGTRMPVQKAIPIPVTEGAPLAVHWFDGEPPSAQTWIGGAQLEPRQSGEAEAFLSLEAGGLLRVELRLPGADRAPVRLERPGEWTDVLPLAPAPPPRDEAPSSLWSKLRRLVGNR